jgi:hypothetical protein
MPPFQLSPKTIGNWIGQALNDPDKTYYNRESNKEVPAACVRLALVHNSPSGEKEVDGVPIGSGYDDDRVLKLAERFFGRAQQDAQGQTGRQQYIIYAFYEGSPEPQSRYPFQLNGHIVSLDGELGSEPPTPEGRLSQRMRQDEANFQVYIGATMNLIEKQNRFMEIMSGRLEKSQLENMQMFEALRDARMREVLSDHDLRMKEESAKQKSTMIEGAVKLAPALINRLTGQEIVPHSTEDSAILEALAGALTVDDIQQLNPLLAKLPQSVVGMLMSRLAEIESAKQKRKKELATTLKENESTLTEGVARKELEH